jgi:hypothetical protein
MHASIPWNSKSILANNKKSGMFRSNRVKLANLLLNLNILNLDDISYVLA